MRACVHAKVKSGAVGELMSRDAAVLSWFGDDAERCCGGAVYMRVWGRVGSVCGVLSVLPSGRTAGGGTNTVSIVSKFKTAGALLGARRTQNGH